MADASPIPSVKASNTSQNAPNKHHVETEIGEKGAASELVYYLSLLNICFHNR